MQSAFVAIISCLLLVAGIGGVYESRLYSARDQSAAPLLATLYPVVMGVVGLFGAASLLWLFSGRSFNVSLFLAIVTVSPLTAFVQHRMHRKMGRDSSPLLAQLSNRFHERYGVHR